LHSETVWFRVNLEHSCLICSSFHLEDQSRANLAWNPVKGWVVVPICLSKLNQALAAECKDVLVLTAAVEIRKVPHFDVF
jgi:hypothetical protein